MSPASEDRLRGHSGDDKQSPPMDSEPVTPKQEMSSSERPSRRSRAPRASDLNLSAKDSLPLAKFGDTDQPRSPTASTEGQLSPAAADRVFPIRSVVSVDPAPTPHPRTDRPEGYFNHHAQSARRSSINVESDQAPHSAVSARGRHLSNDTSAARAEANTRSAHSIRQASTSTTEEPLTAHADRSYAPQLLQEVVADASSVDSGRETRSIGVSDRFTPGRVPSFRSNQSSEESGPLVTARFKHVVTEGGHAIITGRDGETLQRCEDEPIHIPGAIQGFGLLIALEEQQEGKLIVRVVSENSKRLIGYTPQQLFSLESFTDILSDEQADNLLDHVDFIRDEEADVVTNGPEVFTMSIRTPQRKSQKFWCAMHINDHNPKLVICEFELEDDPVNPLVPPNDMTPEPPEDTLNSQPTAEEFQESTQNNSKPLRVLRSARKRKGEAAAMEVFNIMSQVQEQLAAAPNLETFLKILVGVVKELTGFHRVMVYQFDQNWNGRVVTELVDPRATKDLYKGLNFPASDIPKQARDLYKINKVRMLYDRDQETARLVCRTLEDLETPLDLTYSYLRAMSPIHIKYLGNMAVRSSMSISINAFEELWGLIACHSYGSKGMRVSFPIRKMCRLVGDSTSRNIERLSYASRLQARKLINTVPTQSNPSGYIIASSEDLLKLFDADFGLLSIRDETKILGHLEHSQEALAMLEYLRMRCVTSVMTSQVIKEDFPDLRYPPGFKEIAGLLLVPLSVGGQDFIVFFRKGQLKEVKWAGNPYEKYIKEGTEGYLEPRKSFRTWSEMVVGKCREWSEEEIETAAVLCLVYGKFIEVWRQKEAALQNSQLTRLLLANSAHEVRTPLNAIINYLEIALEGTLDQETRDNLAKSHSASKSLIYVINDLLDLTKTEEGGELVKDELFDLGATLSEATDMFKGDARRKGLNYEVSASPGLPRQVIGDQRRVRQAISNVTANAIQNTKQGTVKVEMYVASYEESRVDVEVSVSDTGIGMNAKKLDALFRELEQVQSETGDMLSEPIITEKALPEPAKPAEGRTLGLGLAVVARIIRNMNGQLRLKSEEGKGSRFVIQFPFDIQDVDSKPLSLENADSQGSVTPHAELPAGTSTTHPEGMMTLVERSNITQQETAEGGNRPGVLRKTSAESAGSRNSLGSFKSSRSNLSKSSSRSGKSEADRLIEAIQEPHKVDGWHEHRKQRSNSRDDSIPPRPALEQRHTTGSKHQDPLPTQVPHKTGEVSSAPEHQLATHRKPGETEVMDSGIPIRPVRIPDDYISSPVAERSQFVSTQNRQSEPSTASNPETNDTQHKRVLVAEDDPVNSRIIKKRLDRLGHEVSLTVNGEECASNYCDSPGLFDIVLMDMQMPIVDGLTSAKMIRSFEKSHPTQLSSGRADTPSRVPIIAVSASLIEKERQVYIDGGFDGWILKPISFSRLSEIMEGMTDQQVRRENLYHPGSWERGGWFAESQPGTAVGVDTKPNLEPPQSAPSEGVQIAAAADDPHTKEEADSTQSREQARLAQTPHDEPTEIAPAQDRGT